MNTSLLVRESVSGLEYRVRVPPSGKASAMLVLLHGVGGNENNLMALAEGVSEDTLVVFPRGRLTLGADQFAWFVVSFTSNGPQIDAPAAEASRVALIVLITQLQKRYGIIPDKTVVAGFSQGGILSASVALTAPELLAGFAVLSGRILPEIEPYLAEPAALARLKGFIAHGRDDSKLPVVWAERADAWLQQLAVPHITRLYDGGHGITAEMAQDFLHWHAANVGPIS